jgi:hypothetical protein
VQGWLLIGLTLGERLLAAASALALLHGGWQSDLGGAALLAALVAVQVLRRSSRLRRSGEGASG